MVKTILFYVTDQNDGLKAIKYLIDDIKADPEADHKLFFKFLMQGAYYISMGTVDNEGKRHMIGDHEVIFMPATRLGSLENKNIIFQKNCMFIAGDSEKTVEFRKLLIDWLLEKKEELENE